MSPEQEIYVPIVLAEAGPIVGIVEVYKRPIGLSAHIRAGR